MLLHVLLLWCALCSSLGNTYDDTLFINDQEPDASSSPRSDSDFWLYQRDMWLDTSQTAMLDVPRPPTQDSQKAPAALPDATQLWEGGIIPYVFDCSLKNMPGLKRVVKQAMQKWEENTCLKFVERDKETDYVTFFRGSHSVGRTGKKAMSIGHNCEYLHVMLHELGHVIGFWHEQSRPDRDEHVTIVWKNVVRGWKSAFMKLKKEAVHSMQVPYDYASIMHYPFDAFSKYKRRKTIEPLRRFRGRPYRRLSTLDVVQANILYQCPDAPFESNSITVRRRRDTGNEGQEQQKCEDKKRSCSYWTSLGFCDKRQDIMLTTCMRSCNACRTEENPANSSKPVSARKPAQGGVFVINRQTTTPRPPAQCRDTTKACPYWTSMGYCKTRPDVMHVQCRHSCNICPVAREYHCIDKDPRCRAWANRKFCNGSRYSEMMARACRRSCRLCTVEPTSSTHSLVESPCEDILDHCSGWAKLGFCRSRPRFMDEYCKRSCYVCSPRDPRYTETKCLDNFIACAEWKKHNYCTTRKTFMEFNCKKTCELCRREEPAPATCEDKNSNCARWARDGECHARVLYMIKYCQRSCNICDSGGSTTPAPSPPCEDRDPRRCPIWAQLGRCDTHADTNKYCRVSCGVCFPERASSACKNKANDLSCKHWAGLGLCQDRPQYMIENCQDACNACPKEPPKTIPDSPKGIRCTPACKDWLQRGQCGGWRRCWRTCMAGGCDDEPVRPEGKCSSPMGLGWDGTFPDSAFNASSTLSKGKWDFGAHNARLYREDDAGKKRVGGWCAEKSVRGQWIQVDLGQIKYVTAIATQGRDKFFEHVKTFGLSYSKYGRHWTQYKEKGRVRILSGNCDHFTPVINKLRKKIKARYIKIYPKTFQNICMRLEIYGCPLPQG